MGRYGPGNRYELSGEHRAQLGPWAQRWIANALNCEPMDDRDRAAMIEAVNGMYDAAGLQRPLRVVFVPSPLVAAAAGGFAAWVWWVHDREGPEAAARVLSAVPLAAAAVAAAAGSLPQVRAAMDLATIAATQFDTAAATWDATQEATREATYAATREATAEAASIATWDATWAATAAAARDATAAATWDTTDTATANATQAATSAATRKATSAATQDATLHATAIATREATSAATQDATLEATHKATFGATQAATLHAMAAVTHAVTHAATREATDTATDALLRCARNAWRMWDGGNQWSAWAAYLSFFRHIAKLDLDVYERWDHYERAAIHGGPRVMHPRFCIVSDRPLCIHRDEQHRPHCETGPYCQWADGWQLWYWHGVRAPRQVIEAPETLTVEQIRAEQNVEVRRVMVERFGQQRFLAESGAVEVDRWDATIPGPAPNGEGIVPLPHTVTLQRADRGPGDTPLAMIEVTCPSTGRRYLLRVPPAIDSAERAWRWTLQAPDDAEVVAQT